MAIEDTSSTTRTDQSPVESSLSVSALLNEDHSLAFCGLSDTDEHHYPNVVDVNGDRFTNEPLSLMAVIKHLPTASSGKLFADNRFVTEDGVVDTAAIQDVDGLDSAAIEQATGISIGKLAQQTDAESLVPVTDHQDIIDERRLALQALGAPVKFRWQIASDRYCIVPPAEAYRPAVRALQKHGATDAFGWAHYRDWGGELKLSVVLPDLKRILHPSKGADQKATAAQDAALSTRDPDAEGLTVFGGFQTGYDFRGSQAVWATPLLYVPENDVVIHGIGQRYSRRHVGKATNAAHERANDRVPIKEWWEHIYDELDAQTTIIDRAVLRSRAVTIDFEAVPYSITEFYDYLGIPTTYAEEAAERASTFASPRTRPTLWNLQLSLLVTIDALYGGSQASDTYLDYNEVAQQILRQPARSLQLAAKEHDLQADNETQP